MSTHKKEKIPDSGNDDTLWETFNINNDVSANALSEIGGLTFNLNLADSGTAGTIPPSQDDRIEALLTDIWHNQATIIKWLSKIAENTKRGKNNLKNPY